MSKRKRALKAAFIKYYWLNGEPWRVNGRKSGIYKGMFKPMIEQLFAMRQHHNKLLVVRFDLHQSHATEKSDHVSRFVDKLKKRLKRKYKLCRVGYIWVREEEKSKHQHYHLVLIIDGNKASYPDEVLKIAEQIWHDQSMGYTFSIAPNPFYHFKRNDIATLKDAVWRISYLAKGRGKGYRTPQAKDYATSRIKCPITKG
ncbi:MAG: inovirus Gp2 family protein [Alteromonadales bacterium]|nr:inovirus Gp2 family protein [Alteromonadales bacterium]